MFIQTEETPNPDSLKFLPGRLVAPGREASFDAGTVGSPLATRLLGVTGVQNIFLGSDFVTVTKTQDAAWPTLKPILLTEIMEHFLSGAPILTSETEERDSPAFDEADPVIRQIRELIDTRIRPSVAMDGGDIVFHAFVDGIVYLQLRGACSTCPSSQATLKVGVERMLRHYVPEVLEVQAVEESAS